MSAVASSEVIPSVAVGVPHAVSVRLTHLEAEAAEQKRWMTWFGLPALFAAVFVSLVFATGQEWYLGLAIGAIVSDIGVLTWLALSSDTNAQIDDLGARAH
jgi:membrane protein implicated in regulation of membrane protease activity